MSSYLEQYGDWIVNNEDKKGTPDFETVANAYKEELRKSNIEFSEMPSLQEPNPDPDGVFSFAADQAQSVLGKGLEAVGRLTGFESVEDYGTELYEQQKEDIAAGGYKSDYGKSFADTFDEDGVGSAIGWIGEKIAENSITTGAALVGAAGTAVAALFSAPVAAVFGVGTFVGSALLGTGEVAEEIESKTGDYDPKLAVGVGTFIGFLDKFGATKVIPKDQLAKLSVKEVMKQLTVAGFGDAAKAVARRTLIKGGYEGLTESGQELASVGASAFSGGEYTSKEIRDRLIDSFAVGTGMGGGVSLGVDATSGIASLLKKDTTETTPTETTPTETTPTGSTDSTADAIQTSLFPVNEQDKIVKDLSKELGISEAEVARELSNLKNTTKEDTVKSPAELRQEALLDPQNLRIEEPTIDTQQGTTDPNQLDIVDQLETKQLEEMIAEDTKVQDRETQRQQAVTDPSVRAESEFETARGTLEASQQKTSTDKRSAILQDVVAKSSKDPAKKNINKLRRDFSKALSSEGIVNTAPTEAELNTLQRATDVLTAVESQYDMPTQREMFPGETKVPTTVIDENFDASQKLSDFVAMETSPEAIKKPTATVSDDVAKKQVVDPNQLDLGLTTQQEKAPVVEPAVEPVVEPAVDTTPAKIPNVYSASVINRDGTVMKTTAVKEGNRWKVGGDFRNKNDKSVTSLVMPDGRKPGVYQLKGNSLVFQDKASPKELIEAKIAVDKRVKELNDLATPAGVGAATQTDTSTQSKRLDALGKKLGKSPLVKRAKKETKSTEEILIEKITPKTEKKIDIKKQIDTTIKIADESIEADKASNKLKQERKQRLEEDKELSDKQKAIDKIAKDKDIPLKKAEELYYKQAKNKAEAHKVLIKDKFMDIGGPASQELNELAGTEDSVTSARLEAESLTFFVNTFPGRDVGGKFTDEEFNIVNNLLLNPPKKTNIKKPAKDKTGRAAAYVYFSKQENPRDVLDIIAHDTVNSEVNGALGESKASQRYFNKTGRKNAELARKWITGEFTTSKTKKSTNAVNILNQLIEREQYEAGLINAKESSMDSLVKENITEEAQTKINKSREEYIIVGEVKKSKDKFASAPEIIVKDGQGLNIEQIAQDQNITVAEAKAKYESVPSIVEEKYRQKTFYWLETSALSELDKRVHPVVRSLLEQGKLKEALIALSSSTQNKSMSKIALSFSKVVGNTKVKFVNFVTNNEGNAVSGLFDPTTNTIFLDRETGFNAHTILHEMTHAATSSELANPQNPSTKQLNTLFEAVRDDLGTIYGSQNLDEFVAEARSNPKLRLRLARMNPKTGGANYLERFNNIMLNIIRRLFSQPTKTVDTALSESDRLIEGVLSPSPESRNADKLFMDDKNILKVMASRLRSPTKKDAKELNRYISNALTPKNLKRRLKQFTFYGWLPLFNFVNLEVVKKYLPMAQEVDTISRRRAADIDRSNKKIESTLTPIAKWSKKNIVNGQYQIFSDVIFSSTLANVIPYLPLADAKKKYKDPEKLDAYLTLRDEYRKLDSEGQKYVKTMFNVFIGIKEDVKEALLVRLESTNLSSEEKTKLSNRIYEKMFNAGLLEVYAPLMRKGDYWMQYTAKDPVTRKPEVFLEGFESMNALEDVKKDIDALTEIDYEGEITEAVASGMSKEDAIFAINGVEVFEDRLSFNYKDAPSGTFVNDVLEILQVNKVDSKVEESIMNLYVGLLPEASMAKGFIRRRNIRGFDGDVVPRLQGNRPKHDIVRAFKMKASSMARQITQLKYSGELSRLQARIDKHVKENHRADSNAFFLKNQLKEYMDFIANEDVAIYTRLGTGFGFAMTLGANLSSALMNPFQIALNGWGFWSGKYGDIETIKTISLATKLFLKSGRSTISEVYGADSVNDLAVTDQGMAGRSIGNYDFEDKTLAPEILDLDVLEEMSKIDAQLQLSFVQEQLDMDYLKDDLVNKTQQVSGYMFHHSERFVRQVTLATTYILELQKLRQEAIDKIAKDKDIPLKKAEELYYKETKKEDGTLKQLDKSLKLSAYNEARFFNEMSNGGAIATGAPPLASGKRGFRGIIKIAFLFKRFGVTQALYLGHLVKRSFVKDNAKNRKKIVEKLNITDELAGKRLREHRAIAKNQLVRTYLAYATIAGVMGLPGLNTLGAIYDMLFVDDDDEDFKTMVRNQLHALPRDGLVNFVTGVDFASRLGLADFVFRESMMDDSDKGWLQQVGNLLGGPVVGVANNYARAIKEIKGGEFTKGIRTMMPTFFKNMTKGAITYPLDDGVRNKNYDLIYDTSPLENLGQFFGFTPVGYKKKMEQANAKKSIEIAINKKASDLKATYYAAFKQGDDDMQSEIMEDIQKFNTKHPQKFISLEDLAKSVYTRSKTSQQVEMDGVYLDKKLREDLNKTLDGWDSSLTIWQAYDKKYINPN